MTTAWILPQRKIFLLSFLSSATLLLRMKSLILICRRFLKETSASGERKQNKMFSLVFDAVLATVWGKEWKVRMFHSSNFVGCRLPKWQKLFSCSPKTDKSHAICPGLRRTLQSRWYIQAPAGVITAAVGFRASRAWDHSLGASETLPYITAWLQLGFALAPAVL